MRYLCGPGSDSRWGEQSTALRLSATSTVGVSSWYIQALLTGHGSLNEFIFSQNFVSSQSYVQCGADSEDWFHILCACPVYCDIRNLDNMDVQVVNSIFDFSQGLANNDTLQYSNLSARATFHQPKGLFDATSFAIWWATTTNSVWFVVVLSCNILCKIFCCSSPHRPDFSQAIGKSRPYIHEEVNQSWVCKELSWNDGSREPSPEVI